MAVLRRLLRPGVSSDGRVTSDQDRLNALVANSEEPNPEIDEHMQRYCHLESVLEQSLHDVHLALADDPDNEHLEVTRNHLSAAFIALERANQSWIRRELRELGET